MQVAPFLHGLLRHSSKSEKIGQQISLNYATASKEVFEKHGNLVRDIYIYIIHSKQRYPFRVKLTKSKTKNIKIASNPINLIFQGVVLEGA